jgi:hypothetical protein
MIASASDVAEALNKIGRDLLSFRHRSDASYVHLPLLYPSGTSVTLKITPAPGGRYRISDSGFGMEELESIGAQSSFARTADKVIVEAGVFRDARCVFADADLDQLTSTIIDVGTSSWRIVDKIFARRAEENDAAFAVMLAERLVHVFGAPSVQAEAVLVGASTSKWPVTAIVTAGPNITAFQAVAEHANSIYRANAAFDDLLALPQPPRLVAVVRNKASLGPRLTLLSRGADVIESGQPDADYIKAAA